MYYSRIKNAIRMVSIWQAIEHFKKQKDLLLTTKYLINACYLYWHAAQTWTLYGQIVNKLRTILSAMERAMIEMKFICRAKREINVPD